MNWKIQDVLTQFIVFGIIIVVLCYFKYDDDYIKSVTMFYSGCLFDRFYIRFFDTKGMGNIKNYSTTHRL